MPESYDTQLVLLSNFEIDSISIYVNKIKPDPVSGNPRHVVSLLFNRMDTPLTSLTTDVIFRKAWDLGLDPVVKQTLEGHDFIYVTR